MNTINTTPITVLAASQFARLSASLDEFGDHDYLHVERITKAGELLEIGRYDASEPSDRTAAWSAFKSVTTMYAGFAEAAATAGAQ